MPRFPDGAVCQAVGPARAALILIEWEDAGTDRLVGAAEAARFVRTLAFDAPTAAFDAAFSSD